MTDDTDRKTCFVVMGFGEKTDFQTQRVLDLDKTYRVIIKKAVEQAGLKCVRADEVLHSGIIDKPMYELLLRADLVIADLSTSNANAIYELGVRHALRPNTTIVIAEKQFQFPFDIKSLLIRTYEHLGKGIDAEEAENFREGLVEAIRGLVDKQDPDSPVYTFLPGLEPPAEGAEDPADGSPAPPSRDAPAAGDAEPPEALNVLVEAFQEARASEDWVMAKLYLQKLRDQSRVTDPYVIQQLAFATYQSKQPDPKSALEEAKAVLADLDPESSRDTETTGIWGAIHKRLWDLDDNSENLETALRSYERGYYLKDDYYNGINYAFLLDTRAAGSEGHEAIADAVGARRVRRRVIGIAEAQLAEAEAKVDVLTEAEKFWLKATLVEAKHGIGALDEAEALRAEAVGAAPEAWMEGTLTSQLEKLAKLLELSPLKEAGEAT